MRMVKPASEVRIFKFQGKPRMHSSQALSHTCSRPEEPHTQHNDLKLRPEFFQLSFGVVHVATTRIAQ
jgi:hypothetical protein